MGAFNFAFFCFGYYVRGKKQPDDAVELTKENAEFIKEMMDWRAYNK